MADQSKMNPGQAGSPFDPYNLSEIEKIQLDIERDLNFSKIENVEEVKEQEVKELEIKEQEVNELEIKEQDYEEHRPSLFKLNPPDSLELEPFEFKPLEPTSLEPTSSELKPLEPLEPTLSELEPLADTLKDPVEVTASVPGLEDLPSLNPTDGSIGSIDSKDSKDRSLQIDSNSHNSSFQTDGSFQTVDNFPTDINSQSNYQIDNNFYTETIKQQPSSQQIRSYRRLIITLMIVCTLGTGTLGIGVGFGIVYLQRSAGIGGQVTGNNLQEEAEAQTVGSTRLIFDEIGPGPVLEGSLADVVRLVDPAVVRITTVHHNFPSLPFFGEDANSMRIPGGSGVIFARDHDRLFILTNNHVVSGADRVDISIMDYEPISARPVGRNISLDLAVISVSLTDVNRVGIRDVSIAAFGDSDAVQVGDVVLVIGNAMGEGNSTTSGIISAAEKEVDIMGRTLRVLQTDAAINPGNSGGPLVNKHGQVIGINIVTMASDHYAIEGMGFSVPSNVVKPAVEEIMNAGPSPFLGIEGRDVDPYRDANLLYELGIPPIGIYVAGVFPGTGADRAGIRQGDIITGFNGRTVFNMTQLVEEIVRSDVGDTVEVLIIRERRQQLILQVTLGENNINNF